MGAEPRAKTARAKRRLALIDADTGEVMPGLPVLIPTKPAGIGDWFMTMQQKLSALAADPDLNGETWRVLAFMLGQMDFENWVRISQVEIAKALGMERPNVTRSVRKLLQKGVIEKAGTRIGGSNVYRIAKDVAWRGSMANWRKAKHGEKPPALQVIAGGAGSGADAIGAEGEGEGQENG